MLGCELERLKRGCTSSCGSGIRERQSVAERRVEGLKSQHSTARVKSTSVKASKQFISSPKATEKSCVNNEPKPHPSPELHPHSSTCGGKPKLWSAGVSMASLLLVVQGLTHTRSPLIPELLLQNISLFLFKPWNEPVFTSAFRYCSLFSWNLFLFNSGGPKITANFLQGICSLKHTVWHFSFSSFFYFFLSPFSLRLALSLLRTCKCSCFWMLQGKCWKWQLKWNH